MNNLIKETIKIEDMIYEFRGKQVMLDSDLAKLYQCANGTKIINQVVKRHINRFPDRFMFQLTKEEYEIFLRSQVGTLEQGQYSKYLPYAFTEHSEYHNLMIIYDDTFHDRYFILDREIIYHCGTSINHAGSKTFSINKLEDGILLNSLLNRMAQIDKIFVSC